MKEMLTSCGLERKQNRIIQDISKYIFVADEIQNTDEREFD